MYAHNVIDEVIRREGSTYTNDPTDRGGPTKYGITQRTLSSYRGTQVTPEEVAALTEIEARVIYTHVYMLPFQRFAHVTGLHALCVDSAVQHGVERVQGWLKAIPSSDPDLNYAGLLARRMRFYGEIVANDPSQVRFIKGWLNRLSEFAR